MADAQQLQILKRGVEEWNQWRRANPDIAPDLSNAVLDGANFEHTNLKGADLSCALLSNARFVDATLTHVKLGCANLNGADLTRADLRDASLGSAKLIGANLSGATLVSTSLGLANMARATLTDAYLDLANVVRANLEGAVLCDATLVHANLSGSNLSGANLAGEDLRCAILSGASLMAANLSNCNLREAILVGTDCQHANFNGSRIYGASFWNLNTDEHTKQRNVIITEEGETIIAVDNLEVAQFIHLLLNNKKIRNVIDTISSKTVLILGRFTEPRKLVLNTIRDQVRERGYLPIVFDADKPTNRDLTETISILAHMARFVIADITDAKSIPQELQAIVPNLPSVPVQPLLLASQHEYGMFEHFKRYPWVLEKYLYEDQERLLEELDAKVISPAEKKCADLRK